jgi:hypothetical protein
MRQNRGSLQSKLWEWTSGSIFHLLSSASPKHALLQQKFPGETGLLVVFPTGHFVMHALGSTLAWERYLQVFLDAVSRFYEPPQARTDMYALHTDALFDIAYKLSVSEKEFQTSSAEDVKICNYFCENFVATEILVKVGAHFEFVWGSLEGFVQRTAQP